MDSLRISVVLMTVLLFFYWEHAVLLFFEDLLNFLIAVPRLSAYQVWCYFMKRHLAHCWCLLPSSLILFEHCLLLLLWLCVLFSATRCEFSDCITYWSFFFNVGITTNLVPRTILLQVFIIQLLYYNSYNIIIIKIYNYLIYIIIIKYKIL